MEVPLSKRIPLLGTLSIPVAAAVVALATVVAPSFAGSYLTRQQAMKTFVKKADIRPGPVARIVPNTADVGPLNTKSAYDIPGARAVFKTTTETSDVVITFSAQTTCTAATSGVGCPIQVVVDGYANPKVNLLTSSGASPAPKESMQSRREAGGAGALAVPLRRRPAALIADLPHGREQDRAHERDQDRQHDRRYDRGQRHRPLRPGAR